MERTCKKCGETKPIEEFEKSKGCNYGYSHRCKKCCAKIKREKENLDIEKRRQKGRRQYNNNRDHYLMIKKEWRKKNPNKVSFIRRKNYLKHKNERCNYSKIYYQLHPETCKERHANYRINNRIKILKKSRGKYKINQIEILHKIKEDVKNLTDNYIEGVMRLTTKLNLKTIRQHPELIENYRQQIKIKRLLKQKKNENTKTG